MSRGFSKKKALRPPFLITVATLAGSLVPGCGGAVTSDGSGTGGGGGMTGTSGTSITATGTDTTATSGTTIGASSTTGMIGTTGTSGAGGAPPAGCPTVLPPQGTPCAPEGLYCGYPCTSNVNVVQCSGGRWLWSGSCNPPPPTCPPVEPTPNTPCVSGQPSFCTYTATCCGLSQTHGYICTTGTWKPAQDGGFCAPPPPACPAQPPADGDSCCFSSPLTTPCSYGCRYEDGGAFTSSTAKCDGTRWYVSRSPCIFDVAIPPRPDVQIDDAGRQDE
jgi:hypothetical protein